MYVPSVENLLPLHPLWRFIDTLTNRHDFNVNIVRNDFDVGKDLKSILNCIKILYTFAKFATLN